MNNPTPNSSAAEIARDLALKLFQAGYDSGHHDTVEGHFHDDPRGTDTEYYHGERVSSVLEDAARIAALSQPKEELCGVSDIARLDKLERYLSDPAKMLAGPEKGSHGWEFGYNGGSAYVIEGGGKTLREAIDSLQSPTKEASK